ncbi:hypothetical protein M6D93_11690 [Jatrophihabitans telluris]|uniref:DUF4333 domain-containing protein n=1 Tax=Jatrophihabitans telluris TaxID=2038343 RepID=A0ABY4QUJ6_9ACTN|nr:hypothetical protein [Jatrophihabitans telluris]UQX86968.1 hypothetical protein M6D93_11690 [Jatrophihabitans telluris]
MYPEYQPVYPNMGPVGMPVAPQPRGRGLAIAGLIVSIVALIGVLVIGVVVLATVPSRASSSGQGALVPLTGQLNAVPSGALSASALATAVRDRIAQDGGSVSRMDCPPTPKVAQNVVSVCHGSISGDDYAVLVFFEDAQGRFTLEPV